MWKLCSLLILVIIACAYSQHYVPTGNEFCTNADTNGILETGCWGYKECVNETVVWHVCKDTEELDRDTMRCVVSTYKTTCSRDLCVGLDGMYSNMMDDCHSFFTCTGGTYLGHNYCAATLVFNETIQVCDYPENVFPPCGTKTIVG